MDSVFGLPAHPLVVHGAVVLVPLAAGGAALVALSARWRERIGWLVVALTAVGVATTFAARQTGEALEEAVEGSRPERLLEAHTDMGEGILLWVLPLAIAIVALMVLHETRKRAGRLRAPLGVLGAAVAAIVLLASAAATVGIVRVGHSGATSVWSDVEIGAGEGDDGSGG